MSHSAEVVKSLSRNPSQPRVVYCCAVTLRMQRSHAPHVHTPPREQDSCTRTISEQYARFFLPIADRVHADRCNRPPTFAAEQKTALATRPLVEHGTAVRAYVVLILPYQSHDRGAATPCNDCASAHAESVHFAPAESHAAYCTEAKRQNAVYTQHFAADSM